MKEAAKKRKIINDPVYGFIDIPSGFIFELVEGPWLQRLRRIRQLGLTNYVYPGANHSRFQHSLGAFHLMSAAVSTLRMKGVDITADEEEAIYASILLHDTGHGPFSHALEYSITDDVDHEVISSYIMEKLNENYGGRLSMAIEIFRNSYHRKFLHNLIAGQTDMDRLDYLTRDSFFTGVIEGSVSSDRIIKMLNVDNDRLVIDEKGIYSLEKFLIARRMMYWQVYMHKTVIAAEMILSGIIRRARELAISGVDIKVNPWLEFFLMNNISAALVSDQGKSYRDEILKNFMKLDDNEILQCTKIWMDHPDKILSALSSSLLLRRLPAIELSSEPFDENRVDELRKMAGNLLQTGPEMIDYFVFTGEVSNRTYTPDQGPIGIMMKKGGISDISEVSDIFTHNLLSQDRIKYFLCYPKNIR
ncbi:MAG: HD domain-containing protein [Bacteroidales bacterium]